MVTNMSSSDVMVWIAPAGQRCHAAAGHRRVDDIDFEVAVGYNSSAYAGAASTSAATTTRERFMKCLPIEYGVDIDRQTNARVTFVWVEVGELQAGEEAQT